MGNSQSQRKIYTPHHEELSKLFENLVDDKSGDGNQLITQYRFEEYFSWQDDCEFGKLLFKHVTEKMAENHDRGPDATGSAEGGLDKNRFVRTMEAILDKGSSSKGKLELYSSVLTDGKSLLNFSDLVELFHKCWGFVKLESSRTSHTKPSDKSMTHVLATSVMGVNFDEVSCEKFLDWAANNIPCIFDGLHCWVVRRLLKGRHSPAEATLQRLPYLPSPSWSHDGAILLTPDVVWVLSMLLPSLYHGTPPAQQAASSTDMQLQGPEWTLLYDCVEHGQSLNRFKHHCFSYHGPTVLIAAISSEHLVAMAVDTAWRECSSSWGSSDCFLVQLQPQLNILQAGKDMVFFNERSRGLPTGLVLGPLSRPCITIDTCLATAKLHYQNSVEERSITKLEVWGCAGGKAKEQQIKQQQWERNQAEKLRKVKLPGKWDDNPDKAILEMAGITTNHSQR